MVTTAKVVKSGRKPPAVRGNRKGVPNKNTAAIKDMILQALDNAGGAEYLERRANDPRTAAAFLGLIGKVLPMQVTGDPNNPLQARITVEYVAPK
jgi:hypothetical protein